MKYRFILIGGLIVAIIIGAIYILISYQKPITNFPKYQTKKTVVQNKTTVPKRSASLVHVFIIMEENKPLSAIENNPSAPFLNSLIREDSLASNYYGVTHPSLPNYLALTSGSTDNITNDCNPPSAGCEVNVPNIADQIEKSGRTWKEYAESMPSNCYAYNSGLYVTKHNPFIYYSDIINNPSRCQAHVVPFHQLKTDLQSVTTTPDFAFITPNICNDMHDCSVATGDTWLSQTVPMILNSKAFTTQNSLLVITWDEGYASTNHIPTILIGNDIKKGFSSSLNYNHYSLLHTIEEKWGLTPLTPNVQQAPLMNIFFN